VKGDHLGEFEELVLLAVRALDDAYGVTVQRLLEDATTRSVSLGAAYAALERLESKGLVRSQMTAGTAVRGGRSRRVFRLTADGARTLLSLRRLRERLYVAGRVRAARPRAGRA
jgi:DNA-binding PadR family transcriptional regulator